MFSCIWIIFTLPRVLLDTSYHCNKAVSKCASLHTGVFFFPLFRLSVCQILPKGVVSVIGPASSPASGSTVSHICGEKEVSWKDETAQERPCDNVCMQASGAAVTPAAPLSSPWWMNAEICFFFLPIKWTRIHFLTFIPSLPVCLYH